MKLLLSSAKTLHFRLTSASGADVAPIHIMDTIAYPREAACDDAWCKFLQSSSQEARRCYASCSLLIAYCFWGPPLCNVDLTGNGQVAQLLFPSGPAFADQLLLEQYRALAAVSGAVLLATSAVPIGLDWMLVSLIGFGFLPPSSSWTVLHSGKTRPRAPVEATCYCRSRHGASS